MGAEERVNEVGVLGVLVLNDGVDRFKEGVQELVVVFIGQEEGGGGDGGEELYDFTGGDGGEVLHVWGNIGDDGEEGGVHGAELAFASGDEREDGLVVDVSTK